MPISKALRHGPCITRGSHSFYLPLTPEQYMPLFPSHKASLPIWLVLNVLTH